MCARIAVGHDNDDVFCLGQMVTTLAAFVDYGVREKGSSTRPTDQPTDQTMRHSLCRSIGRSLGRQAHRYWGVSFIKKVLIEADRHF